MPYYTTLLTCIACLFSPLVLFGENVGLLVMATGKYIQYVDPLISSAEKHFCKNHKVTYFIFTDSDLPSTDRIVYIKQKRLGWPFDTMMRYHTYLESQDILKTQDYLFACDADMLFVDEVGDEILSKRVATLHPSFVGQRGTYETNPDSKAYIPSHEGECYFAGGFYGGEALEVLRIAQVNANNIDNDLKQDLIAIWHDESHWNRYCVDNQPTLILSPSYCYPESWGLPYTPRLLALDKNHHEMRNN